MFYIYLPKKMKPNKETVEKIGFTFEDVGEEVFYKATLPDGWCLKAVTANHSILIDENGNCRGTSYYNPVSLFADMYISPRFYIKITTNDELEVIDAKNGSCIFKTDHCDTDEEFNQSKQKCIDYLNKHYPEWEDVTKYWD